MKREELTQVQKDLLAYWDRCEKEKGYPPSVNSVAKELGYKSVTGVYRTVQRLVLKGFMQKKQVKGRMGNTYSVVSFDSMTSVQLTDIKKN